MPSETSPASSKDFGPRIAPIMIGIRSCTGRAKVKSPLYLKKSPSKVIAPSSRNVRITWCASFTRESGLVFVQSMLVLREQPEVADREDALPCGRR